MRSRMPAIFTQQKASRGPAGRIRVCGVVHKYVLDHLSAAHPRVHALQNVIPARSWAQRARALRSRRMRLALSMYALVMYTGESISKTEGSSKECTADRNRTHGMQETN